MNVDHQTLKNRIWILLGCACCRGMTTQQLIDETQASLGAVAYCLGLLIGEHCALPPDMPFTVVDTSVVWLRDAPHHRRLLHVRDSIRIFCVPLGASFDYSVELVGADTEEATSVLMLRYRTQNGLHDMCFLEEGPPNAGTDHLLAKAFASSVDDAQLVNMLVDGMEKGP